MIVLYEVLDNSGIRQDPLVIAFEEKTALIAKYPGLRMKTPGSDVEIFVSVSIAGRIA